MKKRFDFGRIITGGAAGLAGSFLMLGMQAAGQRSIPRQMPPLRQHPGKYMVEKAEEMLEVVAPDLPEKVPESVEKIAAELLGVGYGVSFALLYSALRPKTGNVVLDGSALGLACWAAGYLGWLPATRLMPPITRQKPVQVFGGIASHLLYGIATTALYRKLRTL
jgi:hypothetical protein